MIKLVDILREISLNEKIVKVPQEVLDAYQLTELSFGNEYIIPKPFDPRLMERVSGRVADAARAEQGQ